MEALTGFRSLKWGEKAIGGIRYDAILGRDYPVLSVSEQFDPTFMQYIDRENERVTDYMDNYLAGGGGDLAKSSAFAFFPEYALVGRISGTASKSVEPLKKALDHFWPQGKEYEWDVQPVITIDSIERFKKELKELHSFNAKFTTRRTLDSVSFEGGTTGEFYGEISDAIGADLDVEIKVSIPSDALLAAPARKFKEMMGDFVSFAAKQNRQMQVNGIDLAGKLLELKLVEHPVVEQEDIIIGENEPKQFTSLVEHLIKVCAEKQTDLYQISGGEEYE
ncbi:ImpB/MucB/SamB family protein [Bifidobacterium moraviense]|uniref:ImpB/MucB/SamB family protein n=1 Tax=Bifidobacterium moraviense TaxID=2675323 RepID=UPI002FFCC043